MVWNWRALSFIIIEFQRWLFLFNQSLFKNFWFFLFLSWRIWTIAHDFLHNFWFFDYLDVIFWVILFIVVFFVFVICLFFQMPNRCQTQVCRRHQAFLEFTQSLCGLHQSLVRLQLLPQLFLLFFNLSRWLWPLFVVSLFKNVMFWNLRLLFFWAVWFWLHVNFVDSEVLDGILRIIWTCFQIVFLIFKSYVFICEVDWW